MDDPVYQRKRVLVNNIIMAINCTTVWDPVERLKAVYFGASSNVYLAQRYQ